MHHNMDTSNNSLSDDDDLSDAPDDIFSDNESTTSDVLPVHDEFTPADLLGYPASRFRTMRNIDDPSEGPVIDLNKLKTIERLAKEILGVDPQMVERVSRKCNDESTKETYTDQVGLRTAARLVFKCGEVWRYKKGIRECENFEQPCKNYNGAKYAPYLGIAAMPLDRITARGSSSALRQFAQVLFFRHGHCLRLEIYEHLGSGPVLMPANRYWMEGRNWDNRPRREAFEIAVTRLQWEFTQTLVMSVYEWVTVLCRDISSREEIMQPEARMRHWESSLTVRGKIQISVK